MSDTPRELADEDLPARTLPVVFHSMLFEKAQDSPGGEMPEAPAFFADLNLDQVVDAITDGRQEYNLKPFFYTPLKDRDAIGYRQEIMQDLESASLLEAVKSFAGKMHTMRVYLALIDRLHYTYNKEGWFLEAVAVYCDAVTSLAHALSLADLRSRGFVAFRDYLTNHVGSDRFVSLLAETRRLKDQLSAVRYCLLIDGNRVIVRKYESEIDYSAEVERTFEKFKQGAVKDYRIEYRTEAGMNHVEAKILDLVAQLYPDVFSALDDYCARHGDYLDEKIAVFDREIQFYVAYLDYIAPLREAGLKFCYPRMSTTKTVDVREGFDLALAHKLVAEGSTIVCNDFYLRDGERIIIVTGPNQGGKTTFARTFGQLHYLASIGCPVPGSEAQLFLYDGLFTHFEKEEDIRNLRGKLQDDLIRIHDILSKATSDSIVIMNEIFTATTLTDAIALSKKIMDRIAQLDLLCVWVTFIVELASGEKAVSMVSTVAPENPALRTYKILRRPADGLAYAISIAEKHRLTYGHLMERIGA